MAQATTTLNEAAGAFRDHAADTAETTIGNVISDLATMNEMAAAIVRCARELERLTGLLDSPALAKPFAAASLDEYAAVEGFLYDNLTGPAERYLKRAVKDDLSAYLGQRGGL